MKKLALFLLTIPCFAIGMSSKLATLKALVVQQNVFTISYLQLDSNFFVLRDNAFKHTQELNMGLDLSKAHYFEAKMRELQANGSSYLQTIKQEIQSSIVRLGDRNTQRPVMENHIQLIDNVLSGPDIKKIDDYLTIKALAQEGKADQATILLDIYKRAYGEADSSAELYAYISSIERDIHQSQPVLVSAHQSGDIKLGEPPQAQLGQKFSYIANNGSCGSSVPLSYGVNHAFGAVPNITPNAANTVSIPSFHRSVQYVSEAYQAMYDAGDIKKIKKELDGMSRFNFDGKAQLNYLLSKPVMKLLETVQTGSLEEAKAAIQKIRSECKKENFERQANHDVTNFTERHVQASYQIFMARKDYQNDLYAWINTNEINPLTGQPVATTATANTAKVEVKNPIVDSSIAATTDLVRTFVHPVTNISIEIDTKVKETLNELKEEYPDFQQYMQAVGAVLQDMKNKGLLNPTCEVLFTPEVCETIAHGAKHFVQEFELDDPRENPREFIEAVLKYGVCAAFHIMTDGVFLGAEKLALIGTQVHALLQTDFSGMNAKQKAEFIAERVADIIKTVLADQIGRKIISKSKLGRLTHSSSISSTREVHEAVTSEGLKIGVSTVESDASLLKNESNKQTIGSMQRMPDYIKENRIPLDRETILIDPSFTKTRIQRVKGAAVYEKNNMYYHRDTFHTGKGAHLEVYNKQGAHLGEANPLTGELIHGTMDKLKSIKKLL